MATSLSSAEHSLSHHSLPVTTPKHPKAFPLSRSPILCLVLKISQSKTQTGLCLITASRKGSGTQRRWATLNISHTIAGHRFLLGNIHILGRGYTELQKRPLCPRLMVYLVTLADTVALLSPNAHTYTQARFQFMIHLIFHSPFIIGKISLKPKPYV